MPNVCAYCGRSERLTREHLWPASIIKRVQERARYNTNRGPNFFWGDPTIRDVCAGCNNGPLSKLDEYGIELYDKLFNEYAKDQDTIVNFEYDFPRLARWLLKLSYNSARAAHAHDNTVTTLAQYADPICNPSTLLPDNFSILVDLVVPDTIGDKIILPKTNRLCNVQFNPPAAWCVMRLVAINSWYFWILIQTVLDRDVDMADAQRVMSNLRGIRLDPGSSLATVRSSGSTTLDLHHHWVVTARDAFRKLAQQNTPTR